MKKLSFLACLVVGGLLACTSTSTNTNDAFLIKNLDDQSKSRALTEAGVEEYDVHLVRQAVSACAVGGVPEIGRA